MEAFFNRLQKAGVAMMMGGFLLTRFVFTVDGGERALIYDKLRGVQDKIYGEGMHFYVPVFQVSTDNDEERERVLTPLLKEHLFH